LAGHPSARERVLNYTRILSIPGRSCRARKQHIKKKAKQRSSSAGRAAGHVFFRCSRRPTKSTRLGPAYIRPPPHFVGPVAATPPCEGGPHQQGFGQQPPCTTRLPKEEKQAPARRRGSQKLFRSSSRPEPRPAHSELGFEPAPAVGDFRPFPNMVCASPLTLFLPLSGPYGGPEVLRTFACTERSPSDHRVVFPPLLVERPLGPLVPWSPTGGWEVSTALYAPSQSPACSAVSNTTTEGNPTAKEKTGELRRGVVGGGGRPVTGGNPPLPRTRHTPLHCRERDRRSVPQKGVFLFFFSPEHVCARPSNRTEQP